MLAAEAEALPDILATAGEPEVSTPQSRLQPTGVQGTRLSDEDVLKAVAKERAFHPWVPEWCDQTSVPRGLVQQPRLTVKGRPLRPLSGGRQEFNDTSWPWRTVGKIVIPLGDGRERVRTGALVGPRHMLTCSHGTNWDYPNYAMGPLKFMPGYYNGPRLGEASATYVYWYRKVGENPSGEFEVAEDYICCVLDQRLGDQLGWLGGRVYDSSWDGEAYWTHVGYPTAVAGGERPSYQTRIVIEDGDSPGYFNQGDGLDLENEAELSQGDSGGPFWGRWDGHRYIVGVTSGSGHLDPSFEDPFRVFDDDNWAGGGDPMIALVNRARSEYP